MRTKITINEPDVITNQAIKTSDQPGILLPGLTEKKSNLEIIASEGSADFVNYLEWLGFSNDLNLVVLSSVHHYYYDAEEMKNVRTLVNLIELNLIKQVTDFIYSIFNLIPSKSYFIGCFVDNQKNNKYSLKNTTVSNNYSKDSEAVENGISSRIPFLNVLYNLLDAKINKYLSKNEVAQMLNVRGFRVVDMTELNGLTYFCAQKQLPEVK
jgi:hypothetical protein